jgi:cyclophilin family peptidyl-prolyl cis-trans isomerase
MRVRIDRSLAYALGLAFMTLLGCNREKEQHAQAPTVQTAPKIDNAGKPIAGQLVSSQRILGLPKFAEAVSFGPPDKTCTGKNTGKIFEMIQNDLWDKAVLTNNDGKRVRYQAVLATELGEIHFDLLGDIAPNHVRNFVCLARAGYYDNMKFYNSVNETVVDNRVAYIETGCPRGTGESGSGSIGYWLKPEFSDKVTHDEGVVGACLNNEDPDSASCRFYITAARMPQMDENFTIFAKVTRGLDIVRAINKRAVDNDNMQQNKLKEPVLIRNVSIRTTLE